METFYTSFDTCPYPETKTNDGSDSRSVFQRDRDRVIFSYAFRRLQSKTQVFQSGEYDFYRTRLTHSLEVARIARSITEELARKHPEIAIDTDLVEAVGLAHDLGHPPFGHIGERKLNQMMAPWGGFEGNAQTVRILTDIFWERTGGPQGMAPSRAFLDGVMKYKALHREYIDEKGDHVAPEHHFLYNDQEAVRDFISKGTWQDLPPKQANRQKSIECQIMDWADDTAYSLHDIVDGVKAGFITRPLVEKWLEEQSAKNSPLVESPALEALLGLLEKDYLEAIFAKKVGEFLRSARLVPDERPLSPVTARHRWRLDIPEEIQTECALYKSIALQLVFRSARIQQGEFKSGFLLERLFNALFESHLHSKATKKTLAGYDPLGPNLALLPQPTLAWVESAPDETTRARRLCDYLAQLTDHEAIRMYRRLFDPDYGSIRELL